MQRLYTVPKDQLGYVFCEGHALRKVIFYTVEAVIRVSDVDGAFSRMTLIAENGGASRYSYGFSSCPRGDVIHIHCRHAEFTGRDQGSLKVHHSVLEEVYPRLRLFASHNSHLIEVVNDVKKKVADELASVKSEIAAIKDLMIEALAKYEWHRDVQRAIAENKLSLSE